MKKTIFLAFLMVFASCTNNEDHQLITFQGRVLLYDGPYVSNYETLADNEFSPAAGIELVMVESGPCGWHSCERVELDTYIQTNENGYFEVDVNTRLDREYYVQARFPSEVRYSVTKGERIEEGRRVIFADIILVSIP